MLKKFYQKLKLTLFYQEEVKVITIITISICKKKAKSSKKVRVMWYFLKLWTLDSPMFFWAVYCSFFRICFKRLWSKEKVIVVKVLTKQSSICALEFTCCCIKSVQSSCANIVNVWLFSIALVKFQLATKTLWKTRKTTL